MILDCYRLHEDVTLPRMATARAACFDIFSYLLPKTPVVVYDMNNKKIERFPEWREVYGKQKLQVYIEPADRILIPTGLIFKIPDGYSMRMHSRSSVSLKKGLLLANGEGIVDNDYYHETFIILLNSTADTVWVGDRERIAQGELVRTEYCDINETFIQPEKVSDRVGGFGSTGVN